MKLAPAESRNEGCPSAFGVSGCATAATFLSPSLTIPFTGEVIEGGACLVGGIMTGFGFGALGSSWGQKAVEDAYGYVTRLHWTQQ